MAISSTLTGEAKQQADMQAEISARSEAGAADAVQRRWSVRDAHWDKLEEGWAADRRRAAGLTADDMAIVNHFIEFAQHVDRLRVAGKVPAAVKAWERMSDRINELEPPVNGTHRLWAHASQELRTRYRFAHPESRLVKEGFSEFCSDCAGGFYREHESAPAERAPSAPSAGERVDASGAASGERADGDCVRIELSR